MPIAKWKNTNKLKTELTDPITCIHEYQLDIQSNHVFLFPWNNLAGTDTYGEGEPGVEFTMSSRFAMNARICMMVNPETPMTIHMKTCGGDWDEGMAIFDILTTYPNETTILNYTHARSMSSIIFQAATKRVMMPHSHFMFHDGTYGDHGVLRQVRSGMQFYEAQGEVMMDIYAIRMKQRGKFSKWSLERIKDMMRDEMNKKEDVYLDARTTVDWGLADEIFDGDWSKLNEYNKNHISRNKEYATHFISK
jgi:ATP-dependent protease ClpP protease subunit